MSKRFEDPAELVRAAIAALEDERWDDVALLVHPSVIERFRDGELGRMLEMESRPPRTAEELRAEQPWLPPEEAAHYAAKENEQIQRALPHLRAEWGVSSFSELEPLTPAEFLSRHLKASSPAVKVRVILAAKGITVPDDATDMHSDRHRRMVLGEVREGGNKAHVLIREFHGRQDYDPETADGHVQILTLTRIDDQWWVPIDHTLLYQQGMIYVKAVDPSTEATDTGEE